MQVSGEVKENWNLNAGANAAESDRVLWYCVALVDMLSRDEKAEEY